MPPLRLSLVCLALVLGLTPASAWANSKHVYLLRGLFNVSTGLDEIAARLKKAGIPASVYGDDDGDDVAAEAIRAYRTHKVRSIVLIGHSLGAGAAVSVAEELNAAKVPVALLITLDQGGIDAIPPNVRRAINFYVSAGAVSADKRFRGILQNIDVGNIPGMDHMGVQGTKIMQDRITGLARAG